MYQTEGVDFMFEVPRTNGTGDNVEDRVVDRVSLTYLYTHCLYTLHTSRDKI